MIKRQQINDVVRQIAQVFRPERIVLFGSYAYGRPTRDSDVDLMVIATGRGDMARKAAQIHAFAHAVMAVPFPLDVLVRTPAQVKRRLAMDDLFLLEVMKKGKVLYEADGARVGRQGRGRPEQHIARTARAEVAQL